MEDNIMIDKNQNVDERIMKEEINNTINKLEISANNKEMLTQAYTEILLCENVVYLLTKISQNKVFQEQFPEMYAKKKVKTEMGYEFMPESVINCQQNSHYHKYGVFKHILHSIEYVGNNNLKLTKNDLKLLKWTMLLHDIGKPMVKTINENGTDSFEGHEEASYEIAKGILDRFSFSNQDKEVILKLIRYHDKYLNVGEITYDNLSFLAKELDDKKELFDLLIEVKIADNKAKSFEVEQTFMRNVEKYYEFETKYFSGETQENIIGNAMIGMEDTLDLDTSGATRLKAPKTTKSVEADDFIPTIQEEKKTEEIEEITEEITNEQFDKVYNELPSGQNIEHTYTPIINIDKNTLVGYEVVSKINNYKIEQLENIAKGSNKYAKLCQQLLIMTIEQLDKSEHLMFIPIDMKSFEAYNNKQRIYDMFVDKKIVLEFINCKKSISYISKLAKEIVKRKAQVLLQEYKTDDLNNYENLFVKYNLQGKLTTEAIKEISSIVEICQDNNIQLIVDNVTNITALKALKKCKVEYVMGEFFGCEQQIENVTENKVIDKLK